MPSPALLRLEPVRAGARIAVLSLASAANPERVHAGVETLRALGFDPVLGEHALGRVRPYFAATPEQRLHDLHRAIADPAIAAIICTRGGYGSNYLLEALDLDLFRSHPKPIFGYSDYTAMQTWLLDQTGLPAFHGPMAAADFSRPDGFHLPSFYAALAGEHYSLGATTGLRAFQSGEARGTFYGGCLSLLTASLGTRFAPLTEGKLLFLEDVGAKPYQVDRMLRQLMLAGKLEDVSGIIFGEMLDCVSPGASAELLEEAVRSVLHWFHGPIAFGLRSGHVSHGNVTLPFGWQAQMEVEGEATLRLFTPHHHQRSEGAR